MLVQIGVVTVSNKTVIDIKEMQAYTFANIAQHKLTPSVLLAAYDMAKLAKKRCIIINIAFALTYIGSETLQTLLFEKAQPTK